MKTKINLAICTLLLLVTCFSNVYASGKVATETRNVEKFTGVELKSVANVFITQGEIQEVKIETSQDLVHRITTKVKNDELIIDCDENIKVHEPVNVYITVKELCLLELSGSGNITTKNEVQCEHMTLKLSGSGDMSVMIKSHILKATLSGSGNMKLNGSTPESNIRISGSGNVNAEGLKTFSSTVNISGSGNTKVDAGNELTVSISGSGNVLYLVEPAKINSRISGSGEVQKI